MAMITSTKHKIREHPWWVLSYGFYTAIDMGDAISCHLRRHPGESRREWGGCGR